MTTSTIVIPSWCSPTVWDALVQHGQALTDAGGRPWPKGLNYIAALVAGSADEYEDYGSKFFDFQPGNGTSYKVMITDLARAQADYLVWRRLHFTKDRDFPLDREEHRALLADARLDAANRHVGPAYSWGGDTLVAFPTMNRCVAYQLTDYLDPSFITEHLRFRLPDAVPVSAFLSLFGAAVENHRKAA